MVTIKSNVTGESFSRAERQCVFSLGGNEYFGLGSSVGTGTCSPISGLFGAKDSFIVGSFAGVLLCVPWVLLGLPVLLYGYGREGGVWQCAVAGLDMGVGGITAVHGTHNNGMPGMLGMTLSYRAFNTRKVAIRPEPSRHRVQCDSICTLGPRVGARFGVRNCPYRGFVSLILGMGPARIALIPSTPSTVASGTN